MWQLLCQRNIGLFWYEGKKLVCKNADRCKHVYTNGNTHVDIHTRLGCPSVLWKGLVLVMELHLLGFQPTGYSCEHATFVPYIALFAPAAARKRAVGIHCLDGGARRHFQYALSQHDACPSRSANRQSQLHGSAAGCAGVVGERPVLSAN
jgi:hypothetical protein